MNGSIRTHRKVRAPRVRDALALTVFATLVGALAQAAAAPAADPAMPPVVARATPLHRGEAVLGALPRSQPIHVEVALRLRHKDALDAFVAASSKGSPGGLAQPMSDAQFLADHAPTPAQAQAVADYLGHMGFTRITTAPNRLLVSADGTAASASIAFLTTFAQVRARDGRIGFANAGDARMPSSLGDSVLAVVGLQSVHPARVFTGHTPRGGSRGDGGHTLAATPHDPTEFPAIYGGAGATTAPDTNIGLVTAGDLTQTLSDLATFASNEGMAPPATLIVTTNGTSSDTSHTATWNLESQAALAMAGQVKKLQFYNIPSLSHANLTADYNAIASAHTAKIVIVPVGSCETDAQADGSAAADDAIFETAVAQGQTFVVAAGDTGADACGDGQTTPNWPASSQYVVAAAGTKLNTNGSGAWLNEVVWNEATSGQGTTGGSPSLFEPRPDWQSGIGIAGDTRVAADVAFDADLNSGSAVVLNGSSQCCYGGTSLAASLFAGTWARVLQQYPTIGFAGPVLYALPATDFHDVTTGHNGGEDAAAGYDAASGLGSLKMSRVLTDAHGLGNQPPTAGFSFTFSGLTVDFTDTSSDSDGSIASHSWDFGDGATSTAANPSHTYAADGFYSVSEKVKDAIGASTTSIQTVAPGTIQLLGNPGFETGAEAPWVMSTPSMLNNSRPAHTGSWSAEIGYVSSGTSDEINQVVAIPAGKTSATLAFYVNNCCDGISAGKKDDLYVNVYDAKSHTLLGTLTRISKGNLFPFNSYLLRSFDVTPYIGRKISIKFIRHDDPELEAAHTGGYWLFDDITLTVQ